MKKKILLYRLVACLGGAFTLLVASTLAADNPTPSESPLSPAEQQLIGHWTGERATRRVGKAQTEIDVRSDHTFSGSVTANTRMGRFASRFEGRWRIEENGKILVREYSRLEGAAKQMENRTERLTLLKVTANAVRYRNGKGVEIVEHRETQ